MGCIKRLICLTVCGPLKGKPLNSQQNSAIFWEAIGMHSFELTFIFINHMHICFQQIRFPLCELTKHFKKLYCLILK